jgi:large subunit ribosomal protein L3
MKGILGRKIGMTQVFGTNGKLVPVTVIEVNPNVVTQVKTLENDGYEAIQLGYETIREKLATKASVGHSKKANTAPKRFLREIKGVDISAYTLGQDVKADLFEAGEIVDVTGISKGKGYQGVIKKNNQHRGPMGHGSKYHRGVGSLGTMLPKRVLPGKALPGHMGSEQVTIQNLEIIKVDMEDNCILVKGSVPGPNKSLVIIKSAVKTNKKNDAFDLISYAKEEVLEQPVVEEVAATEEVTVDAE